MSNDFSDYVFNNYWQCITATERPFSATQSFNASTENTKKNQVKPANLHIHHTSNVFCFFFFLHSRLRLKNCRAYKYAYEPNKHHRLSPQSVLGMTLAITSAITHTHTRTHSSSCMSCDTSIWHICHSIFLCGILCAYAPEGEIQQFNHKRDAPTTFRKRIETRSNMKRRQPVSSIGRRCCVVFIWHALT